jgi:hypothetical protein
MENMDFNLSLKNAEKYLANAEHILNFTFRVINEKRLLLTVAQNLFKSLLYGIDSVLKSESVMNKTIVYSDSMKNFQFFKEIAENYGITRDELRIIDEIFAIVKKHKESPLEFVKGERVIVMSDAEMPFYLDFVKIKNYFEISKRIIEKIKRKIII